MITVAESFLVAKPVAEVFKLFERFETIASCLPTLKSYRLAQDGTIDGLVGVTLGAIPVESRVRMRIERSEAPRCLVATGISFMGETVEALRAGRPIEGMDRDSVGRLYVHFDFRPHGRGWAVISYETGVEAEGRLRKIYEAIIRSKVPAFQREFREKIGRALGGVELKEVPHGFALDPCGAALANGGMKTGGALPARARGDAASQEPRDEDRQGSAALRLAALVVGIVAALLDRVAGLLRRRT